MRACRNLTFFPRATILRRRKAKVSAETIRHVGMIGKAALGRDVGQSEAARNNQVCGTLHTDVASVFSDRYAIAGTERSRKMGRVYSCNPCVLRYTGRSYNFT